MPIMSQPAFGPKLSIGFITGGALMDVWCLVWRTTVAPDHLTQNANFWFWGLLLTGATFILIGAFLGSIGRAARKSELPPVDATPTEAGIQTTAAANPNPMVAGAAGMANGVAANGVAANGMAVPHGAAVMPGTMPAQGMPPARPRHRRRCPR